MVTTMMHDDDDKYLPKVSRVLSWFVISGSFSIAVRNTVSVEMTMLHDEPRIVSPGSATRASSARWIWRWRLYEHRRPRLSNHPSSASRLTPSAPRGHSATPRVTKLIHGAPAWSCLIKPLVTPQLLVHLGSESLQALFSLSHASLDAARARIIIVIVIEFSDDVDPYIPPCTCLTPAGHWPSPVAISR